MAVNALNQLEYSVSSDPDREPTTPNEILEEWLDLDFQIDDVRVGVRYEGFQPHESRPDSVREGIVQRYAEFDLGSAAIRVGNFYEIFGKGLLFRAYEDRSIRIDNNLDGVHLDGRRGPLSAKAFSGQLRELGSPSGERTDVLYGLDLEARAAKGVKVGGSYLLRSAKDERQPLFGIMPSAAPLHIEAIGGRAAVGREWFDAYVEAGRLNRFFFTEVEASDGASFDEIRGLGYYGSLSLYPPIDGVAVTAEYKDYKNFQFRPQGASASDINNPPAVTRESGYTLISRHPHFLNPEDEKGFQVEAVITPSYGTTMTVNRTESDLHSGELYFHEWYAELRRELGDHYTVAGVYDFVENAETGTKDHTPIVEIEYTSDGDWGMRGEYQFQDTEDTEGIRNAGQSHLVLIEYNANADLAFSLVGEHANFLDSSPERPEKDEFLFGQLDYHLSQDHFLSITVGKRRGGFICVGGICRFEPEFEGVEVRFISTL